MMELWRYTYSYQGRWYEAYCYLMDGLANEAAEKFIRAGMDPSITDLSVRSGGHVTRMAVCGSPRRIQKSWAIQPDDKDRESRDA